MKNCSLAQKILKQNTGVIHGRFQVLHNDHLKYLLAGKALCEHLVVGITNPDPRMTKLDKADPSRSDPKANPLTYYERLLLVKSALYDAGLREAEFSVTPFPISYPEYYSAYVPMQAIFFLTIYDGWGRRKLEYFKSLGLNTHVLWECREQNKGLSASTIREAMRNGEPWEHLVPESTALLCKLWDIPRRIEKI
jgi:nicotinamide-nucleotide adenylyltransferase